jgi:hypothetical protein
MSPPLISKAAARYTGAGGKEHCSLCRHFSPRRGGLCARVLGGVSPRGWCKLFSREMRGLVADASSFNGGGGGPALGLDFMVPGVLDPRITFTRASTGTYFDSSGVLQTAAINTPRWDYDPATLALRGLLIEEARTNVLLNSATLSTQSVTVTAVAYTLSFYGTGTITKSGTATGALVGTGATQRVSQTFTPTAGSLTLTVTGTVSNAQLEAGAFVTSYIPTTGATATRAAEQCYIPSASWFTSYTYSLAVEFDTALIARTVAGISDTVFANASYIANSSFVRSASISGTAVTAGPVNKQCATLIPSTTIGICNNGGAVFTNSSGVAAAQTTATRMSIGCSPWGLDNQLSGHIRRVSYWPRVLSNAEMQAVTAP